MGYFESCGFYTYLYAGSVCFMLYLFFYVLRVKYSGVGNGPDDEFDVDDFIRRMTNATGIRKLFQVCLPMEGSTPSIAMLFITNGILLSLLIHWHPPYLRLWRHFCTTSWVESVKEQFNILQGGFPPLHPNKSRRRKYRTLLFNFRPRKIGKL